MDKQTCLPEKNTKRLLSFFFLVLTIAAFISGFTVFPVLGFIMAVFFLVLSYYFYRIHINEECEFEA